MRSHRKLRWALFALALYLSACSIGGVYLADGALHPPRRELTGTDVQDFSTWVQTRGGKIEDESITASDGALLRGWIVRPSMQNGNAVVLLHGVGDNRMGMIGYAQLLLTHGFTVLLPDARAHGLSGGNLATYGLLERNDIREWVTDLQAKEKSRCIYGVGESMGAAQLLQSLQ